MEEQIVIKLYILRESIRILSTVLIILLSGNTFVFAEDKYFLDFNGEYFDLDEGFTGYNMHMILETVATIGFIATAALQDEKGTHAAIGGVSTALMTLPIFVVNW